MGLVQWVNECCSGAQPLLALSIFPSIPGPHAQGSWVVRLRVCQAAAAGRQSQLLFCSCWRGTLWGSDKVQLPEIPRFSPWLPTWLPPSSQKLSAACGGTDLDCYKEPLRRLSPKESMLLNGGAGEDCSESLGLQGDQTSQS